MRTELHRIRQKFTLMNPLTLLRLRAESVFSSKIKIGFGPIKTGEDDLNVRAWRIDPIVNEINRTSKDYVADVFFEGDILQRFDIVVVVKVYGDELVNELSRLSGRQLVVFDVVDNPLGCKRNFYEDDAFSKLLHAVIVSSPTQIEMLPRKDVPTRLIEHPVISAVHKIDYAPANDQIRVIWQGFQHNRGGVRPLEEVIRRVSQQTGKRLKLIYHTNLPASDAGFVQYLPWTPENAFTALSAADIAVTIRDNGRRFQAEKPSTKVIMYMAAGLPLICAPTVAEELVVEHGKTGYLIREEHEWGVHLANLANSTEIRERIGKAAYREAIDHYSVARITQKYIDLFRTLQRGDLAPAHRYGSHPDPKSLSTDGNLDE